MSLAPFSQTLDRLRGGECADVAAARLAEIVKAVESTGKPGTLTVQITVKKLSRSGALELIDKVTAKIPEEQQSTTLLFSTPEGNLISSDGRQGALDLQKPDALPTAANAVRLVAGAQAQ
ncbi:Uncharacterised protein [Bordetella ansorpii]|uniref:Uncharacterized protein n=1 Tax=Bordetella ansorpii TaxID=288768 RepID=A0A157RMC8_9BORD|nr:hypothetical protein [Bordetella ansorpii]SAI59044.1 Uncharacterised protein [Bordetella ansorpii]